jgi:putative toxin-antitoxin system antitoxin component (TIGR02293 family)
MKISTVTDSLDKVAFLSLMAPGPGAERARDAANRALQQTRALKERPELMERVNQVWPVALEVWGDETSAVDFLFRHHAMLMDARPIDAILDRPDGARTVNEILGRLRYGSAA